MGQRIFREYQQGELVSFVKDFSPSKIFLVRANKSFEVSGAKLFIENLIGTAEITSFHNFSVNPKIEDLQKGIEIFREGDFDLIIAIGGGSVLDMAKLISVLSHQHSELANLITGNAQIAEHKTPLLAIPTTAGTGSEATMFSVVYIDNMKYSVNSPSILPNSVYLSPYFLKTASPYLAACTGLDAFCQAVESIWSVNATEESESYGLKAIGLIWNNLHSAAVLSDALAMEQMLEASFLAGKAINITKTTAPHAISYAFTTYYNIPHGHAVALSLPFFFVFNYALTNQNCTDPRGVESVKMRIDKVLNLINADIETAYAVLDNFFRKVGITINLSELIKDFDPSLIAENINVERLGNNPRRVSKDNVLTFLTQTT
ncbi:MAG: phosphonoacetaldehyde reductase [Tenuifilaceae bacterium]|nr:phosphonoacetaldehyde reductase [Tenuifilaceae bacterium]